MNMQRTLNQTAVYWAPGTPTGDGGETFDAGSEMKVRWQKVTKIFRDKSGEESVTDAIVYSEDAMAEDGYLFLGELNDLNSSGSPNGQAGAFQIRRLDVMVDLRGETVGYKAYL